MTFRCLIQVSIQITILLTLATELAVASVSSCPESVPDSAGCPLVDTQFSNLAVLGSQGSPLLIVGGTRDADSGMGLTNFNTAQGSSAASFIVSKTVIISISARLETANNGDTVTYWVTNKLGNGTTLANVVVTNTFVANGNGIYTPITNLTLGPGTYFLTMAALNQPNDTSWVTTGGPLITNSSAISYGDTFAPPGNTHDAIGGFAPAFKDLAAQGHQNNLLFEIDGQIVTPEPSPLAMILVGLTALLSRKPRRPA